MLPPLYLDIPVPDRHACPFYFAVIFYLMSVEEHLFYSTVQCVS